MIYTSVFDSASYILYFIQPFRVVLTKRFINLVVFGISFYIREVHFSKNTEFENFKFKWIIADNKYLKRHTKMKNRSILCCKYKISLNAYRD